MNKNICQNETSYIFTEFNGTLETIEKTCFECRKYNNPLDCDLDFLCNAKKQKEREDKLKKLVEEKESYYKNFLKRSLQEDKLNQKEKLK